MDPQKYLKLWVPVNTGIEALPVGNVLWTVNGTRKGCNGKWKIPSSADYKKLFENRGLLFEREAKYLMKTSDGLWIDEKENKILDKFSSGYYGEENRCVLY